MSSDDVVILAGARTPQGRLLGQLASFSAVELGAIALRSAIERAGVDVSDIDAVIFGPGGDGQHGAGEYADLTTVTPYRNALVSFLTRLPAGG